MNRQVVYFMVFDVGISSLLLAGCKPSQKGREKPKVAEECSRSSLDATGQCVKNAEVDTALHGEASKAHYHARSEKNFSPSEFDKLPCVFFKQGPEFEIAPVPGGPPIPLRGPVQNFYSGKWLSEAEYAFRLSAHKRMHEDPSIPDWLPSPPVARAHDYVLKYFEVAIAAPTSENCKISVKPID